MVATRRTCQRRERDLIGPNQPDQKGGEHSSQASVPDLSCKDERPTQDSHRDTAGPVPGSGPMSFWDWVAPSACRLRSFARPTRTSRRNTGAAATPAPGRARTTISSPRPWGSRSASSARINRDTRCRVTASPTARPTITPPRLTGASVACPRVSVRYTTTDPHRAFRPVRVTVANSVLSLTRNGRGSTTADRYADSRSRPLPRRAASTERPALVLMRVRKPWVLARRRLLGWNVRFIVIPQGLGRAGQCDPGNRHRPEAGNRQGN
jgi:hypothetical protein